MSSTVSCSSAAASVGGRHAELGEDRRHRERVGDVGVAALAHLALVGALGDGVRPLDEREVGLGVGGAHGLAAAARGRGCSGAGSRPKRARARTGPRTPSDGPVAERPRGGRRTSSLMHRSARSPVTGSQREERVAPGADRAIAGPAARGRPSSTTTSNATTVGAGPLEQVAGRRGRAAGGQHVVDDEHPLARRRRRRRAPRSRPCRTRGRRSPCSGLARQLAGLAHRHEADARARRPRPRRG